jgi:hypothetical protein
MRMEDEMKINFLSSSLFIWVNPRPSAVRKSSLPKPTPQEIQSPIDADLRGKKIT